MAPPVTAGELLVQRLRRDIRRHQGRFDQQRAGAAHRVDQALATRRTRRPVGPHQQGRRQVLLQRRMREIRTVATLVQTAPHEVDAQGDVAIVQVRVDAQICILAIDGRLVAAFLEHRLDDAVLDGLGTEEGVANVFPCSVEIDGDGRTIRQFHRPIDTRTRLAQLLTCVDATHASEQTNDAVGQSRPQDGAVGGFLATVEVYASDGRASHLGTQSRQLIGQQRFDATRAGRKPGRERVAGRAGCSRRGRISHESLTGRCRTYSCELASGTSDIPIRLSTSQRQCSKNYRCSCNSER